MKEDSISLWQNAVLTNQIAKIAGNPGAFYRSKGRYLSALRRRGKLWIEDAVVAPKGIILSVAMGTRQLHIFFHQFEPDVQEEVAPIVSKLLMKPANRPSEVK